VKKIKSGTFAPPGDDHSKYYSFMYLWVDIKISHECLLIYIHIE